MGDEDVHSKYSGLFSDLNKATLSTISALQFYKAVVTECLKNVDEVELANIMNYIQDHHQKEVNVHEQSWNGLPGAENESELVNKMRYQRKL